MHLPKNISKWRPRDWEEYQFPLIRYKGVFDWPGLYRYTKFWIEDNRYKFHEKRYKHKWGEVEVDFMGERKIDEMQRYWVYVHFHIWNLKEIETIEEGKKVKRNTGRIHIKIWTEVEVDYTARFDENNFTRMLGRWWMTIRDKEFVPQHLEKISEDVYHLHHDIKILLNMTTDTNAY
jgi:hypothetical protein